MKLTQQLNQKQTQSIKMNIQMQESLGLLKLSNQEILEYINNLVKDNPLLEFEKNKKLKKNKIEFNSDQAFFLKNINNIKKTNYRINKTNLIENTLEQKKNLR